MGTPFISLLEPTRLADYDRLKPHDQQPECAHIPKVFCDAMEVREAVFVREQGVPLEYEHDSDDARSCHWVMYASVNRTTQQQQHDPATGQVTQRKQTETDSVPIGTMRVVPFPHPPHPPHGGVYVDNELQNGRGASGGDSNSSSDGSAGSEDAKTKDGFHEQQAALQVGQDQETTYHDGKEPYVKIGRVAVVKDFRGHNVSAQLWRAARTWLEQNPSYFNPSVRELGLDQVGISGTDEIPEWKGLVCCHAQEQVVKVYERWGFKVDEKMGKWTEEGIPHVGMFMRVDVKKEKPIII
ncbi:uncharacterized protein B0I36DRAFT_311295 [Microdochium trichocladiopsis]|uniref:Uncharacterized protein n=1 Tax=Microdochium trichocladiopsis TaxID=1682393 RepID=A0A9P9BWE1_9PEZI|nr:uncharacterized protein B0I36DRAFT_311295 [Microdochium trichocladiopsis]KAH7040707.1 hypothetical protein B0I36DRAFT_311295 [Microdochium trichocladiopsis]